MRTLLDANRHLKLGTRRRLIGALREAGVPRWGYSVYRLRSRAFAVVHNQNAAHVAIRRRGELIRRGLTVHLVDQDEGQEQVVVYTDSEPRLVVHATVSSRFLHQGTRG